jgi:hypothetical protein
VWVENLSLRFLPHRRRRHHHHHQLLRNPKSKPSQKPTHRRRRRHHHHRLRLQLCLSLRYSIHLYSKTTKLTYYLQLAQLSVHETEPEPEPEAVPPASAASDQGLTAVAQYDYEARVLPHLNLTLDDGNII